MKDNYANLEQKDSPSLSTFIWQDPLLFDYSLKEEEKLLRDSAKVFADKKLWPRLSDSY